MHVDSGKPEVCIPQVQTLCLVWESGFDSQITADASKFMISSILMFSGNECNAFVEQFLHLQFRKHTYITTQVLPVWPSECLGLSNCAISILCWQSFTQCGFISSVMSFLLRSLALLWSTLPIGTLTNTSLPAIQLCTTKTWSWLGSSYSSTSSETHLWWRRPLETLQTPGTAKGLQIWKLQYPHFQDFATVYRNYCISFTEVWKSPRFWKKGMHSFLLHVS